MPLRKQWDQRRLDVTCIVHWKWRDAKNVHFFAETRLFSGPAWPKSTFVVTKWTHTLPGRNSNYLAHNDWRRMVQIMQSYTSIWPTPEPVSHANPWINNWESTRHGTHGPHTARSTGWNPLLTWLWLPKSPFARPCLAETNLVRALLYGYHVRSRPFSKAPSSCT